jgi:hypothetical protein
MRKQQIWQISNKIGLFIEAIGLLTCKVVKQIILPNRKRKGNILSSILLFFVSLNDLLTTFSWGFSIKFIAQWKHYDRAVVLVRKSVFLIGCLLFLLSSFEWSYPAVPGLIDDPVVVKVEQQANQHIQESPIAYHSISFINAYTQWVTVNFSKWLCFRRYIPSAARRIYLQDCNFKI